MNRYSYAATLVPSEEGGCVALVGRFTADASRETFDMPQSVSEVETVDNLIQQKVQQSLK